MGAARRHSVLECESTLSFGETGRQVSKICWQITHSPDMLGIAHVDHLKRTEAVCVCMAQQQAEGSDVEHPLEPSELP